MGKESEGEDKRKEEVRGHNQEKEKRDCNMKKKIEMKEKKNTEQVRRSTKFKNNLH